MKAYYNEIDPFAAQWLQKLMDAGHIAPGVIDTRSIEDVIPTDLAGFTQCHFFAGIGVWSHALRSAGWADDRPVWTGSCPCQPFSAAGKGKGFTDERHLWPAFHWLISQCRPAVVFGEQVASKDGLAWLDLVQADLERTGYACGAADTCAAGFGAPHIRQRLYWVAERLEHTQGHGRIEGRPEPIGRSAASGCGVGGLADTDSPRPQQRREASTPTGYRNTAYTKGIFGGVAHTDNERRKYEQNQRPPSVLGTAYGETEQQRQSGNNDASSCEQSTARPTNGFWRDADWLHCRDGKWRPVEPGSFPLAHGLPERVGLLRGYGNAINPWQAAAHIGAFMQWEEQRAMEAAG